MAPSSLFVTWSLYAGKRKSPARGGALVYVGYSPAAAVAASAFSLLSLPPSAALMAV